ncbi:hypothetical protein [Mariniblastus fucicola]|uniref:Carboxypeptidase regulatory-like domain-containing protein n=1 Tax=Mariniblastus fucicola TaxID=980251 RepID=A0A5B9P916_9BACT|nr:hypothetical protein [Mariniblastus fucicola]QEG21126.1 hypothetical protein MFFC18_09800 [Mariniblastus fucicola]
MIRSQFTAIVFATLILLAGGCDVDWPQETSTCGVVGHVTLDGQAISNVKVVFVPQQFGPESDRKKIASGVTNDRGEFVLKVDARKPKQIKHGRYRVVLSKLADGKEILHERYNSKSVLMVEVDSQEAIQRPNLELQNSEWD